MKRKIKVVQKQNQRIKISESDIKITKEGDFTFIEFPFSSEFPVERIFGKEILSHEPGAMIMDRFSSYMPLLFNHDLDQHLGVIVEAWVGEDKRGYCKAKLSRTAFAKEKQQDIEDKILMNVSFWYNIKDMVLARETEGEIPEYLATSFEPLEISMVTVPADFKVGLARSADNGSEVEFEVEVPEKPADPPVVETVPAEEPAVVVTGQEPEQESGNSETPVDESVRNENELSFNKEQQTKGVIVSTKTDAQVEQERVLSIIALGKRHGADDELTNTFVTQGKTAGEFAIALSEKFGGKFERVNATPVDLSQADQSKYSLSRAMAAHLAGNWAKAGFEKEVSDTLEKQMGRSGSEGFFVPNNMKSQIRSPYLAGTANVGGNLVATQLLSAEFIDIQRAKTRVIQAGARVLSGLKGNVAIPKKSGGSSYYWIAEDGTITQTNATFSQVAMSPKKIGALSYFSRELLQQSDPSIDSLIVDDLTKSIALGQDAGCISGTGSGGQPLGILNQSGIGSVAIGTNGGALSFDHLIDLETAVANQNFDEANMCYMTNATQIGKLKKLKDTTNNYLWSKLDSKLVGPMGEINGYNVFRTNQVPSNLTKGTSVGVCSAVLFGDFSQVILAQWMPGTEILMNPFGSGFAKGSVEVRAINLVDVALRQAGAFAAVTDAT